MSKRLPPQFEIDIKKISNSGEGVGHFKGRNIFVFGSLLGERLLVRPLKLKRGMAKAEIVEIVKQSKYRRPPREEHFLSCSPWQIMPEKLQLKYKTKLVKDIFKSEAGFLPSKTLKVASSSKEWGYRNKMEFSFTKNESGGISLALHRRGSHYKYYSLDGCVLANEKINNVSGMILKILNERKVKLENLKNLVVRYSYLEEKCIAVLYVVDEKFSVFDIEIEDLNGWHIIYSDPRSPATVVTDIIYKSGADYLIEKIGGKKFKYFYNSFFQANPAAFDDLLEYVQKNIIPGELLTDLYSGVGTIGFVLSSQFKKVISVEFDPWSVEAARENIEYNNLNNIDLFTGEAEKQDLEEIFSKSNNLIVDPPRSGLHPRVIKSILKSKPKQFIYISCNPLTQARDMNTLKEEYIVKDWRLFDMYPQTPHVESVLIMKRRGMINKVLSKFFRKYN